jgi:5-oxoprolinase (ATP-hydrolysing)
VRVANEAMCRPIRALMQRYGLAAATHTLGAFGSAGPQHACAIARALGVPRVEIHRHCGVLSAFGIGLADSVREAQRVVALAYDASAAASWDAAFDEMAAPLRDSIAREGIAAARIAVQRFLNLRYRGSDTAIMIARPDDLDYAAAFVVVAPPTVRLSVAQSTARNRPRARARRRPSDVNADDSNDGGDDDDAHPAAAVAIETVRCYFDDGAGWLDTPVLRARQLRVGTRLRGPCHVLLQTSTAVIEPRCEARVTASGNLRVAIDVARRRRDRRRRVRFDPDVGVLASLHGDCRANGLHAAPHRDQREHQGAARLSAARSSAPTAVWSPTRRTCRCTSAQCPTPCAGRSRTSAPSGATATS